MWLIITKFVIALLLSFILFFLLIKVWKRKKIKILVSLPKADRWSDDTGIPMVGGIVFAGVILILTIHISFFTPYNLSRKFLVSLSCVFLMFILGLTDDIAELKSYQKFIGQIIIILLAIAFGIRATITNSVLDLVITFFWFLGISNAFNLIDNMDGLSGGIGLIAFGFLGYYFFQEGNVLALQYSAVMVASLIAFLIFNFKPAKIYLGDNGSLLLGFMLALFTIIGSNSQVSGRSIVGVIVFPVALMLIPIFDTVLVSITRKRRGQSPFQGGRDHLSHRLVMLGMTERQAVVFLYITSFLLGFLFIILREVELIPAIIIYFLVFLGIVFFGIYVGKIRIQSKNTNMHRKEELLAIRGSILYKSQIVKVLIDVIIIALAYYFSFLLRYGGSLDTRNLGVFKQTVVFLVLIKLILLAIFRVYRVGSRYYSFSEALDVVKAVTIVNFSAVVLFTIWRDRFGGITRAVFIIDWMMSILAVGGVKVFTRLFDELFYPLRAKKGRPVVLIGPMEDLKILDRIFHVKNITTYKIVSRFPTFDEFVISINNKHLRYEMLIVSDGIDISNETIHNTVKLSEFVKQIIHKEK